LWIELLCRALVTTIVAIFTRLWPCQLALSVEHGNEPMTSNSTLQNRKWYATNSAEQLPAVLAAPAVSTYEPAGNARLISLDAFRGAIMLLMASSGFGIPQIAVSFQGSAAWRFLGYQFEHAEWAGCSLWDLIQPAFMFMVGVALPWSIANRKARGQGFGQMFGHALLRALFLVLLAVFLTSAWSKQTNWVFTNVLAQVGLGYPFLFLLAFMRPRTQWLAAFGILILYWLAFALYPLPPLNFDWKSVAVPDVWPHLTGFAAHWEKNANFAASFDLWFLNLFPRESAFAYSPGGYQTLNFVPSLATMIFGMIAGRLLRSESAIASKLKQLVIAGVAGILIGKAIEFTGLCPIVKRIWTPGWAIYSSGLVTLLLAGFVALIDWCGWKRWAFPLVVAGLNPITLYCMWQLLGGFISDNLKIHMGQRIFECTGTIYAPLLERIAILLVFWLILLWMYRRKLFLRI
jgi:heparan-alpha-glucosaminide N-acetyltransferase